MYLEKEIDLATLKTVKIAAESELENLLKMQANLEKFHEPKV